MELQLIDEHKQKKNGGKRKKGVWYLDSIDWDFKATFANAVEMDFVMMNLEKEESGLKKAMMMMVLCL